MTALSNASRGSHKVGATVPLPCFTTVMSFSLPGSAHTCSGAGLASAIKTRFAPRRKYCFRQAAHHQFLCFYSLLFSVSLRCCDPSIEVLHRETEACLTGRLPSRASVRRITSCTVASVVLEMESASSKTLRDEIDRNRDHIPSVAAHWKKPLCNCDSTGTMTKCSSGVEMLRLRVVFTEETMVHGWWLVD